MDSPGGRDEAASRQARREDAADAREDEADRRERADDVREGVLDRRERELTERLISLHLLDEIDEATVARQLAARADDRRRRRLDAEQRRDAAIERAIDRATDGSSEDPSGPETAGARQPDDDIGETLARLAALAESHGSLAATLSAIVDVATDALVDADAVSLVLPVEGRLESAASTASWAGELDAAQLRLGRGPILDAIGTQQPVTATDVASDERWGLAAGVGSDAGRAALSTPVVVGDGLVGALTVYAPAGRRFDRAAVLSVAMLATQASLAIGWSLDRLLHRAQTEAWERALASRDEIGQAKGVLMYVHDVDADGAFELLRETSQRLNTKVRAVAEHVVAHRRLPDAAGT